MPMAVARSFGSVNRRATSPNAAGTAMASPMPWANRLATSMDEFRAAPLSAEAAANTLDPDQEHALATQEVGQASAQEQESAGGEHVGIHHPGQAGAG